MRVRRAGELTCRELVELVTWYLEGALDAAERERFERHLALCADCRAYVEQMRTTIGALDGIAERSLAGEQRDAMLRAFRDWKRGG